MLNTTREPGGTPLGEALRSLVLDDTISVDAHAELLVMCAGRSQHVADVIAPALGNGTDVLCERFSGSTMVYQGIARLLPMDQVLSICRFAERGVSPDVVVYLDVPSPLRAEWTREKKLDRIEQEPERFHTMVDNGFDRLADELGWLRVDGTGSVGEVTSRICAAIAMALGRPWGMPRPSADGA
jgi:dTMP kinase